MSTVPENWIPFIPVHVAGSNREIQLQRAAMPRILEGDPNPPVKVQPRTVLLRQGLDDAPGPAVLRARGGGAARGHAGLQSYRAHPLDETARSYVWLRVRRQTGRGEGSQRAALRRAHRRPIATGEVTPVSPPGLLTIV